jgi:BNR repeat-like domain
VRKLSNARKLSIEGAVILVLMVVAGVTIYLTTVHNAKSPWQTAGTRVQDVSRSSGIQTEVAVAVDPSRPSNLVGAANETVEPEIRVFTSVNGGRTWSTKAGPMFNPNTCAWGDPAVAIAPNGRQYVAFTEKSICTPGPDLTPYLIVASRSGPKGGWLTRRVTRPATKFGYDDKPALTVDSKGRVYVAWPRLLRSKYQTTVVSSSADGGKTWSEPQVVDRSLDQPQLVTIAAAGQGDDLYVAGVDARDGLWIGRSTDAGRHFAVRQAAPLPGNVAATCIVFGKFVLPQQAVRCLGPNPTLAVSKQRVFLTYGVVGADTTQDVDVAVFDRALRPLSRGRAGPADPKKSDQFWPVSAVDPVTSDLWACFYDTRGDSKRTTAWFSCTVSADGRRWATPVRPARASSSVQVLREDARIYGYGDSGGYGGYTGLAARGGMAYPMWIDTRNLNANAEEVFSARLPAKSLRRGLG